MPQSAPSRAASALLARSALDVLVTDLVAECTLSHTFRNDGGTPVEVVYSFPLPLDAAFLGLRASFAGTDLEAQVQRLADAEQRYDDAIADGDGAVLLTQPEPGLVCVSLGNLAPGESGVIHLRYAMPLRVADAQARFGLPLAHRPRYGHWQLDALATPDHAFAVEHPLSLHLRARGRLAAAHGRCLTHAAQFVRDNNGQVLILDDAMLDGDLVVVFDLADAPAPTVRCIADGDHTFGYASVVLPCDAAAARAVDLVLLLDGSGSMQGDAIRQSRAALRAVTRALLPDDRIQVVRFGSRMSPLFRRPLKATPAVCAALTELETVIRADLGGTEMGEALRLGLSQLPAAESDRRRVVILVTDGAVQPADIAAARQQLVASQVPVFVVAVGSSAGVEVLEPLATATGARLERAVPLEPIDVCVMRQFRRARTAPVTALAHWSAPDAQSVALPPVFPGDVLMLAARWPGERSAALRLESPAGTLALAASSFDAPPREEDAAQRALLGLYRLATADAEARAGIALHYGLLCAETAAVLVHRRAESERATTLPTIVKVPQMVTRGMMAGAPVAAAAPAMLAKRAGGSFGAAPRLRCMPPGESMLNADTAQPMRAIPRLQAARVRQILLALHAVLRAAWLATPPSGIGVRGAVERLPESLRESARDVLQALWLWPTDDDLAHGAAVFAALAALDAMPPLDDDEESACALLAARYTRHMPIDEARLREALRDGVPAGEVPVAS